MAVTSNPSLGARGLIREVAAVARLDLAEVMRSRWMLFCAGVYALLSAIFVLVGMRESTMMGFTGMGRVLLSLSHALVLLLPLLALTATGHLINRSREDGTLELLFTHPIRREAYFIAVTLVRLGVLIVPLVVVMGAMAIFGSVAFGQQIPWDFLGRALSVSAALLVSFVGGGIAVSTLVRNQTRATIWLLVLWSLAVALLDFALIGMMLQWRLHPQSVFVLASLNPVQTARIALLSGLSAELSVLGPVGFFLSHRLGAQVLYAVGLTWPLLVGAGTWFLALRSFRRADIV